MIVPSHYPEATVSDRRAKTTLESRCYPSLTPNPDRCRLQVRMPFKVLSVTIFVPVATSHILDGGAISRRGSEGCAIGRKRHGIDPSRMPLKCCDICACRHIPQLDRAITSDAEARVVPSGENDTELTRTRYALESVAIFVPVATSHNFTVSIPRPGSEGCAIGRKRH